VAPDSINGAIESSPEIRRRSLRNGDGSTGLPVITLKAAEQTNRIRRNSKIWPMTSSTDGVVRSM
jgi:hypothetical protein